MSLRPDVAHVLGVVGYALMLWCAFGYSWRKNLARHGPGATRTWMRAHVVAGIVGPALVLIHAQWSFRGLAGMTMVLTLVIVASGMVGRYVYAALPPQPAPDEELARIDAELAELGATSDSGRASDSGQLAREGGTLVSSRVERSVLEARIQTLRQLRGLHEQQIGTAHARARWRGRLAGWWALHVPLTMAVLVLALVHAIAAMYYAVP